jgi:mono/diheme cytochrome c family protein
MRYRHPILSLALLVLLVGTAGAAPTKKKKKNARPSDSERGQELYERHCLACHGVMAHADGPMTTSLVAKVPDLTGVLTTDSLTSFVQSVQRGKRAMPAFELSFDKHDARRVLRTMISLQEAAPEPTADTPSAVDPSVERPPAPPEETQKAEEN